MSSPSLFSSDAVLPSFAKPSISPKKSSKSFKNARIYRIIPKYIDMIVIKIVVPVQQDIDCMTLTNVNLKAVFNSNGNLYKISIKYCCFNLLPFFFHTTRYYNGDSKIRLNRYALPNYKTQPEMGKIHTRMNRRELP